MCSMSVLDGTHNCHHFRLGFGAHHLTFNIRVWTQKMTLSFHCKPAKSDQTFWSTLNFIIIWIMQIN